ncbi:MAG: hypothetical protein C4325_07925, partial [Blastocatellia bacterium]
MKWQPFLSVVLLLAIASVATIAQTPTPTPSPRPTTISESAPQTAPEKLIGVPVIAPDLRSDDRSLPELGRVGVNLLDQRTLTLEEAIAMALENNADIEVSR